MGSEVAALVQELYAVDGRTALVSWRGFWPRPAGLASSFSEAGASTGGRPSGGTGTSGGVTHPTPIIANQATNRMSTSQGCMPGLGLHRQPWSTGPRQALLVAVPGLQRPFTLIGAGLVVSVSETVHSLELTRDRFNACDQSVGAGRHLEDTPGGRLLARVVLA